MSQSPTSPLLQLEQRLGAEWKNLEDARALSVRTRAHLKAEFSGLDSEDLSVVVSGSLARDEFTAGSDIDWTLLIDGQADPNVVEILPRIDEIVRAASSKSPGREGTFGTMAFSHDLIHQIGEKTTRIVTKHAAYFFCWSHARPVGQMRMNAW